MTLEAFVTAATACVPFITCGATFVGITLAEDRLIRLEFERYPDEWVKDGKPVGAFYRPAGTSLFQNASTWAVGKWARRPPQWILEDGDARIALKRYRFLCLLVPVAFGLFLVAGMPWSR